EKLRLR
nr:Ig mu chain D region (D23) - mouse [Mus musculus]